MEAEQVRAMLEEIAAAVSNRVTLVCTLFSLQELRPLHRSVYRTAVALSGEPLRLNRNLEEFLKLLEDSGYRTARVLSHEQMRRETLLPRQISDPVLSGFYLLRASFGD